MRWGRVVLASVWAGVYLGCHGQLADPPTTEETPATEEAPPVSAPSANPLAFPKSDGELLPFWVRLNRVSAVVGLPVDDPAFDLLRQNRLDLGDYDHAN